MVETLLRMVMIVVASLTFFSISSMVLAFLVLTLTLLVSFICAWLVNTWFASIILLVYMRGVLVLYFYILTTDWNPKTKTTTLKKNFLGLLVLGGVTALSLDKCLFIKVRARKQIKRDFLINPEEFRVTIFCSSFILLVLWIITKVVFKKFSNMRPLF